MVPTFTFTNKSPSPFPLVSTCCFHLTFNISHGPYFHFHELIHIAGLFIIFHLTFTRSNGPFFHIHQRWPPSRLFVGLFQPFNSSQLLFSLSGIVITAASCFHSMSLFTHSTGPHFTVFTVALPLVGLPRVTSGWPIQLVQSIANLSPSHPPPLYATLILIINLLLLLDFCLFNYSLPFLLSISWLCSLQLYSFKAFRSPKPLDI